MQRVNLPFYFFSKHSSPRYIYYKSKMDYLLSLSLYYLVGPLSALEKLHVTVLMFNVIHNSLVVITKN